MESKKLSYSDSCNHNDSNDPSMCVLCEKMIKSCLPGTRFLICSECDELKPMSLFHETCFWGSTQGYCIFCSMDVQVDYHLVCPNVDGEDTKICPGCNIRHHKSIFEYRLYSIACMHCKEKEKSKRWRITEMTPEQEARLMQIGQPKYPKVSE